MSRATFDFEVNGMVVTPAAMNFHVKLDHTLRDFVPEALVYARSAYVLREYLANVVSRLANRPHR